MKADLARRMSRPLAALGGHNQSRHLHPFSVNHVEECARKCVVILTLSGVAGDNDPCLPSCGGRYSDSISGGCEVGTSGVARKRWRMGFGGGGEI